MATDPRTCIALEDGSVEWRNAQGQRDSWNDRPALIYSKNPRTSAPGAKFWYKNGVIHRDGDLPARVETSGYSEWWHDGAPGRPSGGPNIVDHDGTQEWTDAQLRRHRDGDLPAYVRPNGQQAWYQHGVPHRDNNKPAMISHDGLTLRYFKHGQLHRTDGPALVDRDGTRQWYLEGRQLGAEEILALQSKTTARKSTPAPKNRP